MRQSSPPIRWSLLIAAVVIGCSAAALTLGTPTHADSFTQGGYTTVASASPATISIGGALSISASVTSAGAATVLVDVEVYDPSGKKVYQLFWDNQSFSAGQSRTYPANWTVPSGSPSGVYAVKIGVFSPGWGTLYHWNNNATTFSVDTAPSPSPSPTPGPSATPAPTPTPPPSGSLPALPAGWPAALQLGMASGPGDAVTMKGTAPFGFRYQYLAGGVNTGNGWATWNADGQFVTYYIQESNQQDIRPVFTYYMMVQSAPGNSQSEADGVITNLQNVSTMTAYFNDLKLFFQRAGAFPSTRVVLHVEPDLWGYVQQRAANDNATSVAAQVSATGLSDLSGLSNNVGGFAQAVVRLRDRYALNVQLAYHMSVWGAGDDIVYSNPPDATVDTLARRAGNFYRSLGAAFDLSFAEFSDRDAAFKQYVYGDGGASWWDADDFRRNVLFLSTFVSVSSARVVMWQIPYGNTKMRAQNNTWNHYQDNRVEWLLDDPGRGHLTEYLQAGVITFLFGGGAGGVTCPCDAAGDGVTNPAPINDNTRDSLSADDDGGFFRERAASYYQVGAMSLPGGNSPAPTPSPSLSPSPSPTASPTPTPSPSPAPTPSPSPTASPSPSPAATPSVSPTPTPAPPNAPTRLRAGAITTTSIQLSWNDSSGNETSLEVSYSSNKGQSWNSVTVGANTTVYTLAGLSSGTQYTLRVRACNVAGCSVWSNQVHARTN